MVLLDFPTMKEKQEKLAVAGFVSSCTHFSLCLILCNMYILQAWVWQAAGKHILTKQMQVQNMNHLPLCLRTDMLLFLLSVILRLLCALPRAWPGFAFLLLVLTECSVVRDLGGHRPLVPRSDAHAADDTSTLSVMGDWNRTPEKRQMGRDSSLWPGCVPRALTPRPLLPAGRVCLGSCWGAQSCLSIVPVTRRLEGLFETQALEIKGSGDWYEAHPHLLSGNLLTSKTVTSESPTCVCDCRHCHSKYKWQRILSCRNKSVCIRQVFVFCMSLLLCYEGGCSQWQTAAEIQVKGRSAGYIFICRSGITTHSISACWLCQNYIWKRERRFALTVFLR